MLRRLQPLVVLGVWVVTIPAAGQEATDDTASKDLQTTKAAASSSVGGEATDDTASKGQQTTKAAASSSDALTPDESTPKDQQATKPGTLIDAPPPVPEVKPAAESEGWHTFITGYFRAPMTIGISSRPGPETKVPGSADQFTGAPKTQLSYGPTRTVDSNYYSFAYTRLQEQDWAEVFVHEKKKHVEAVIGWMGYWFGGVGFRNPDAAWLPGMAYLTLDTDIEVGGIKPNIALTAGAWWPGYGYHPKYDTFTLGRFRQMGEQVKLTIPFNADATLTVTQGVGTGRDGSFNYGSPAPYQGKVYLDMIHYENIQFTYKKYVDASLHYNYEWSADPHQSDTTDDAKSYARIADAHLSTIGFEVHLRAPYAGHLWISPSYIDIKNGWALNQGGGGTEIMHGVGGVGIATNFLGYTNDVATSTGTGTLVNLGFIYENTLSSILDKAPGSMLPEVSLSIFGLMANASLDLPPTNATSSVPITQNAIKQFKYGTDVTVQPLNWLGVMARYDAVNYDLDHPGYIFSAITGRLIFSSHFLSTESIYLQYSRYRYGDKMVLAGNWPWNAPLVAGSNIFQSGAYTNLKPDADVVKIQANVAF